VATHEAGHALVAIALRVDVRLATIGDDELEGAQVTFAGASAREQALIRLAGRQALVGFGQLNDDSEARCEQDLRQALAYALAVTPGDRPRANVLVDLLRAEVDDLLLAQARLLGEISIALLQRGELTGAELHEIAARVN
jgi:hypothetical protein